MFAAGCTVPKFFYSLYHSACRNLSTTAGTAGLVLLHIHFMSLVSFVWGLQLIPAASLLAGDECSSEPLEAGSPTRSGSHVSLCDLPALLHPVRADVRPKRSTLSDNVLYEYLPVYHTYLKPKRVVTLLCSSWKFLCTSVGLLELRCTLATTQNSTFPLLFVRCSVWKDQIGHQNLNDMADGSSWVAGPSGNKWFYLTLVRWLHCVVAV